MKQAFKPQFDAKLVMPASTSQNNAHCLVCASSDFRTPSDPQAWRGLAAVATCATCLTSSCHPSGSRDPMPPQRILSASMVLTIPSATGMAGGSEGGQRGRTDRDQGVHVAGRQPGAAGNRMSQAALAPGYTEFGPKHMRCVWPGGIFKHIQLILISNSSGLLTDNMS